MPIVAVRWAIRSSKVVSGERTLLKRLCRLATCPVGTSIGGGASVSCKQRSRCEWASAGVREKRVGLCRRTETELYPLGISFPDSVHALVRDTTAVWGFVTAAGIVLVLT